MFLNQGDGAGRRITVSVSVTTAHGPVRVELPGLVEAAVFAPGHHVGRKAHNAAAMQRTLDDNALWLRRLMPTLLEPAGLDRS